jgi:hypothetical protein
MSTIDLTERLGYIAKISTAVGFRRSLTLDFH